MQKVLVKIIVFLAILFNSCYAQKTYFFTPHQDIAFLKKHFYCILDTFNLKKDINHKVRGIMRSINYFQIRDEGIKNFIKNFTTITYTKFAFYQRLRKISDSIHNNICCNNNANKNSLTPDENVKAWEKSEELALLNFMIFDSIYQDFSSTVFQYFSEENQYINSREALEQFKGGYFNFPLALNYMGTSVINTDFLHNDTSYYYYNNAKKIVEALNIEKSNYSIDNNDRFLFLNINGNHYEWKYNSNGLPEIILKIPFKFYNNQYDPSLLPEIIFINYFKKNWVHEVHHYYIEDIYGSQRRLSEIFSNFSTADYFLKNIINDISYTKNNFLPNNNESYKQLNNFLSYQKRYNKYQYSYNTNGTVSKEIIEHYRYKNKIIGNYEYLNNNLINKINYTVTEGEYQRKFEINIDYLYNYMPN